MFGITKTREKRKEDIRSDMFMLQFDAQKELESIAISCEECKDLGVLTVAYVSIDNPETPYIEYNRCTCGCDVHPRLVTFLRDRL